MDRLLKLTIAILFYFFYKIIKTVNLLFNKNLSSTLVIITYHTVKKKQADKFEKQMDILLKSGHPVNLESPLPSSYNKNFIAVTFDDGYQSILENALPAMQTRKIPASIFVTTGSLGQKPSWIHSADNPLADEIVLTEKQLQTLSKDKITYGSHTVSHTELTNIDENTLKTEINDSKNKLETILKKKITSISVPYGQFDKKFTELFKATGYQRVFLNIPTFPTTKTDLFVMGRIGVDPDDWMVEFRLKLLGAYQWLPFAISAKKLFWG